jgi:hypothetical protein
MKMKKKGDLPTKECVHCKRPFAWRKKWKTVWDEVRFCSQRCKGDHKLKGPKLVEH